MEAIGRQINIGSIGQFMSLAIILNPRLSQMKRLSEGNVPYYTFESIPVNGRVQHAVYTRLGGTSPAPFATLNLSVSVADSEENVFTNRARAYGIHGRTNNTLVHAYLKHEANVAIVTHREYGRYVGPVDGLVTNEPGCGLTMNYADCAAIFLHDPISEAIGLGHAGWKGAVRDLPGAMGRTMEEAFGSKPADLVAAIGPAIGPCCYQVGRSVISAVRNSFLEAAELLFPDPEIGLIREGDERCYFDLPDANRRRLLAAGVAHIEMSGICTACRTDLFFSHRAEKGNTGSFGALFLLNQ
jgi:YfiH family protein